MMRHSSYWPVFHWPSKSWQGRLAYANHQCKSRDPSCRQNTIVESRWHSSGGGHSFGVRRPLRYLAHHLDLDESQTRRMASVLNQLKTEREQVVLDEKRTVMAMAALLENGTPTLDEARSVLDERVKSAEHLKEETAKAVVAISDFLDDDQREEFINLLLTGSVTI
jgi:Spy/CpxP family protein refolding chaperone